MSKYNNFIRPEMRALRKFRLFVKYKIECAQSHHAYSNGIKHLYAFFVKKQGEWKEDIEGLIKRICVDQVPDYLYAWLFENNPDGGYSDVLRAWDERGFELHPEDVKRLNARRRANILRKNKPRNA